MPDEQADASGGGGGGMFTGKIMGIPGIVWLLGAAAIAYFLFSRSSSGGGSGGTSTAGATGSGTTEATGGTTTIDSGAVQVSVTQSPSTSSGSQTASSGGSTGNPKPKQPQPTPKPPPRQVTFGGNTPSKGIKAPGGKDLNKIAQQYGIPEQQLVAFNPSLSKYVGTGHIIPAGTPMKIPADIDK